MRGVLRASSRHDVALLEDFEADARMMLDAIREELDAAQRSLRIVDDFSIRSQTALIADGPAA
jgi:hypothetical protein